MKEFKKTKILITNKQNISINLKFKINNKKK